MPDPNFDKEQFIKAAFTFKERLDLEELLEVQVSRALAVTGDTAVKLVALCRECASERGPVLTAKISENVVQITGGERNVSFAAARGIASDHRLIDGRAEACGSLLVFSHLYGQAESRLISTVRVYKNGDLTDGEFCWSLEGGVDSFLPYLAHIVLRAIFQATIYWPELENMPSHLQNIQVLQEELHEESLKRPCVGFECNLKR